MDICTFSIHIVASLKTETHSSTSLLKICDDYKLSQSSTYERYPTIVFDQKSLRHVDCVGFIVISEFSNTILIRNSMHKSKNFAASRRIINLALIGSGLNRKSTLNRIFGGKKSSPSGSHKMIFQK